MLDRYLFLFGGNPSFLEGNEQFISKAGGKEAKIVLLVTYIEGWEKYIPFYTQPWKDIGVKKFSIIIPNEDGTIDYNDVEKKLSEATGIFIGGGDTYLYQQTYATTPIKEFIEKRYREGVPVAGCSAGALILLEESLIIPAESKTGTIDYIKGIGFLSNILIGVHYSEDNVEPFLKEAMVKLSVEHGLGIDENACAVFTNEQHHENFGHNVYKIKATDTISK